MRRSAARRRRISSRRQRRADRRHDRLHRQERRHQQVGAAERLRPDRPGRAQLPCADGDRADGQHHPAALSLNGLSAANKVYDTTTTAALTGTPNVTPLPGDSVSLSGTPVGAFADKNVGTAKPVTVSNVGLSGTDGANYVLAAPTSLTANITPAPLLIDGYTAANKVYDGTTVATLLGTGSYEPIGSDNVVVVGQPVGTFSSKNVGTRSVTLGGLALGGADGGNYTAVTQSALAADITPAPLAITGVTANNKVYDATTAATLGGSAVAAAFGSDAVSVGGTPVASFPDKNVGTGKAVAVSGYALAGADAANYTVAQPSGLSAASPRPPCRSAA
jgi:hypothetical protein